jgi:putative pyrimidine permease RutG
MHEGVLSGWKLRTEGVILPEERLPAAQTVLVGLQHVVAMFGATVLAPLLMGFDANVAVLFSGIGTLIFFLAVGGRVPSYLGSSFSFIAVIITATGYIGPGPNPNIGLALGGIIAAGAVYTAVGAVVALAGHEWVEKLMPPVVTGAVVAVIGLNLAPIAVRSITGSGFDTGIGLFTVAAVTAVAVFAPGVWRRIPILLGAGLAYLVYLVLANGLGLGEPIDFGKFAAAAWFGRPDFSVPVFEPKAVALIAPVAVVLVAENLGHLKALGAMIGRDLDPYLGRAFIGDGIATMVAGAGGGTGVTTYAENIGVMAVSKIYSTLVFVVAALLAIVLGFSPKFGAFILSIPRPVIGGLAVVLFGLIAATAGRIWVENKVDFARPINLLTVGACLIAGAGDLVVRFGGFTLGGIGTASFGVMILYHLLRAGAAEEAGDEGPPETWSAQSELAQAARVSTVSEMAASIAHEINQPLAAIIANGSAGSRWLDKNPPNIVETRAALRRIVSEGHRVSDVIGSVRAMFKRDSRELTPLELNDLVRGVLTLLRDELRNRGIAVQVELAPSLPPVLADRVQLQQVVLNLIMNAVEAMQAGKRRGRMLALTSKLLAGREVELRVEDSGPGIDPEHRDRIFDPFFTTKTRGMGMGLSICRSIVEAHGGRLWAADRHPHGTTFHVVLPAST